ncbi:MAG: recombinase family protein [Planctomycetota bacterium]|nr:recombinase family protein [Planctomycetota bacterium]
MNHSKITTQHQQKKAYVYVRQSTLSQVLHHQESTNRQYALQDKALSLGWVSNKIRVLDRDLGMSGSRSDEREDFKTLLADVSLSEVGAVLALEASRLARSNTDWHRLIEICSLTSTLIIDEDGIYDPADFNDALLLGLKGTMSAAELHFLKGRLQGGKLNKAERGELRFPLPVGFCWDAETIVLDADLEVQNAVRLVFYFFQETGSAYGVAHRFAESQLKFPKRSYGGVWNGNLIWGHLTDDRARNILRNPAYAGVYAFGRYRGVKEILQDGRVRQRVKEMPRESWLVEIQDHHESYLSWEQHLKNLDQLGRNRTNSTTLPQSAREGLALLQGLLMCNKCGRRLTVRYQGNGGINPNYECNWMKRQGRSKKACMSVACPPLDKGLTERLLEIFSTDQLELALAAQEELTQREGTIHRQWQMRLERATYEANLAQRRYEQVDPDNRLVASSLEQRWNAALQRVDEVKRQMDEFGRRQTRTFTSEQRDRILKLASDFPRLWKSSSTTAKDRKRMLRLLVADITIERHEGSNVTLHVRWAGGACEDVPLVLPAKMADRLRYPQEQIDEVRRLAATHDDDEIAEVLNKTGKQSSHGRPFTKSMIAWIRFKHSIPPVKLKRPGELTVGEVAERFGVNPGVVHYWIAHQVLTTRQRKPGRPHWITLTPEKERELNDWVQRSKKLQKTTQKLK